MAPNNAKYGSQSILTPSWLKPRKFLVLLLPYLVVRSVHELPLPLPSTLKNRMAAVWTFICIGKWYFNLYIFTQSSSCLVLWYRRMNYNRKQIGSAVWDYSSPITEKFLLTEGVNVVSRFSDSLIYHFFDLAANWHALPPELDQVLSLSWLRMDFLLAHNIIIWAIQLTLAVTDRSCGSFCRATCL